MTTLQKFGKNIRKLRTAKELTQAVLAERCDLSNNYIGKLERGKSPPSVETLEILARVLEATIAELFDFESDLEKTNEQEFAIHAVKKVRSKKALKLITGIVETIRKNNI
ncbi:MAG: helix-turn-helix transcriptional regulator [Ignavibacteriae bacterium]|nr:helix-turn-helix transcriptional regulator [Ignavibacteriota bacterium]